MKKIFPVFSRIQKELDGVNTVVHENLSGARVVKAFSKEDYENDRFNGVNNKYADTLLFVSKMLAGIIPLFMLIVYIAQMGIYYLGGSAILTGFNNNTIPNITVGQTTQAITYISMICFFLLNLYIV